MKVKELQMETEIKEIDTAEVEELIDRFYTSDFIKQYTWEDIQDRANLILKERLNGY